MGYLKPIAEGFAADQKISLERRSTFLYGASLRLQVMYAAGDPECLSVQEGDVSTAHVSVSPDSRFIRLNISSANLATRLTGIKGKSGFSKTVYDAFAEREGTEGQVSESFTDFTAQDVEKFLREFYG